MENRHYFSNNDDLQSKRKDISFRFLNNDFHFSTDNGVFAKKGIDYGSRFLLETICKGSSYQKLLDMGCGYGLIGIVLKKMWNTNITMCDINNRAITLSKENSQKNNVTTNIILSDMFSNIHQKFDCIISNPPIRAGKKVIYQFLVDALNYLNNNGELWLVMRKQHGANSAVNFLKEHYEIVEIVDRSNGFWIIKAIKIS